MDWMKIGAALLIVMMLVYLLPRAKEMLKNSPKGTAKDWQGALIPIGIVVLFIVFLVNTI
ncbi:MAG: hypothetical protein OEY38_19325 [Gammaproteobacteria bacterium]|nr:hypothetical protein [Gammaproteobacteria bacterium]